MTDLHDPYNRLRHGRTKRGEWAHNNRTFSRCPNCGTTMIYGICQKPDCGWFRRCAGCKRVLLADGSAGRMIDNEECTQLGLTPSDAYCGDCLLIVCHGDKKKRDRIMSKSNSKNWD